AARSTWSASTLAAHREPFRRTPPKRLLDGAACALEKDLTVKIEEIMTRDVRTCSPDDTLATAAQVMWEMDCGVVPVTDREGKVVGIITDRDLAMAAHLQGVPLRESRVAS